MIWLARLKCGIGSHSGEWSDLNTQCTMVRLCIRCGTESQRTAHPWGSFEFTGSNNCEQERVCRHCGKVEMRTAHPWIAWEYDSPRSCNEARRCPRCDSREERRGKHKFADWEYKNDKVCTQEQRCARCRKAGFTRRTQHDWDSGRCVRCGAATTEAGEN